MNGDNKNQSDQATIDGLTFDQVLGGDIFELVGLKLNDEERDKLAAKMLSTIQIRVFDRVDLELDEAGREQFKAALESNDANAINKFFDEQKIDYTAMVAQEAAKYKIEFFTYTRMILKSGGTAADIMTRANND